MLTFGSNLSFSSCHFNIKAVLWGIFFKMLKNNNCSNWYFDVHCENVEIEKLGAKKSGAN